MLEALLPLPVGVVLVLIWWLAEEIEAFEEGDGNAEATLDSDAEGADDALVLLLPLVKPFGVVGLVTMMKLFKTSMMVMMISSWWLLSNSSSSP